MPNRQIPPNEWASFLNHFSREHEGWLISLAIVSNSHPSVSFRDKPLRSISVDASSGNILVAAGSGIHDHITHTVYRPICLSMDESAGAHRGLHILSDDGDTVVEFRSLVLSELVDGVI